MYNVVEISKILGVSDKTVYRYLRKYKNELENELRIDSNDKKALTKAGITKLSELTGNSIKEKFENDMRTDKKEKKENLVFQELKNQIKDLKEDKKFLREENKKLKNDLMVVTNKLATLLDQEQQLRLQDKKQLENKSETSETEDKKEKSNIKKFFNIFGS